MKKVTDFLSLKEVLDANEFLDRIAHAPSDKWTLYENDVDDKNIISRDTLIDLEDTPEKAILKIKRKINSYLALRKEIKVIENYLIRVQKKIMEGDNEKSNRKA